MTALRTVPPPGLPPIPTRAETIAAHRAAGGAIAAVWPVHYPRALLRAFGFLPVEVWGPPGRDPQRGDAHVQAYTCSIVRSSLAFALGGGLDVASLLVVPHTCDSLQGLASLMLDLLPRPRPVVPIYLPRVGGAAGTAFLASELAAVYDRLAALTGAAPTPAELLLANAREEEADQRLDALMARQGRLPLDDRTFYRVLRAREYLPAEAFIPLADAALALPDAPAPGAAARVVPLLVSGIVPEPMALFDAIADAGGRVVADDLACTGRRRYPPGTSAEPLVRMAERLVASPPDSTRGVAVAERAAHLRALAAASGARAVLFYVIKQCEPELFYLPQLRAALTAAGLPSAIVEVDVADALPHQAVTRVEALLEMVS